ncbi:MAG: DUF4852 domain-containing protein [Gammaproteobacteria bacterium]|nr:DUF4852 domain-containing protein [Gammaproteobacteria bacterium]
MYEFTYKFTSTLSAVVAAAALLALSACGQHDKAASRAPASDVAATPRPAAPDLPTADPDTPEGSYVTLTRGAQLMFLYEAFSGLPPDYERMATELSSEYRGTSDSFRKHDLLEALKVRYSAAIGQAKAHPYVIWEDNDSGLQAYDFDRKGFALNNPLFHDGGYGYMNDLGGFRLNFTNGSAAGFIPMADQNLARRIESIRVHRGIPMKIYAFVQSADDAGGRTVHAQVVKLEFLDPGSRQPLFERKLVH